MTKEEFQNQVIRLRNVYGDKYFPEERVSIFWNKLKFTKAETFERMVSLLIAECVSAPMLQKILEAKRIFGDDSVSRESAINEKRRVSANCSQCGKMGYVLAKHLISGNEYSFRCSCSIAEFMNLNYPVWTPSHEREFKKSPPPLWVEITNSSLQIKASELVKQMPI